MQFKMPWDRKPAAATKDVVGDEAIAFKAPTELSADEERRLKLEIGTNWRPRTSTVKGEGYQFFQGPTPKTGVQEDLPDFFSAENFSGGSGDVGLAAKVLPFLFVPLFLFLVFTLVTA